MAGAILLEARADPTAYAKLVEALTVAGHRVGWLELGPATPLPPSLEAAAGAGVLRAVAAARGRAVSVKPVRGEPVLADLLREHFRGCLLVLVRGGQGLAMLEPEGDGWRLHRVSGGVVCWTTGELVSALGRPSAWRDV